MAIIKRSRKIRHDKHKPEVVTGDFELHFEDVINRNRFALVAILASGLVLLAVFVPSAVYHSIAETDNISVELEHGMIINPEYVTKVEGDVTASGNSYIEFRINKDNE